mgnify:CR=1 FL=1
MASTNFVDYVKTFCRSGAGGRGSAHLHRDKRTMKGGPDGGDGGRGGNVIVRGNRNYWTLIHLKYQRHVFAGDGGNGSEDRSTGADGEDVTIEVPLGTVARDAKRFVKSHKTGKVLSWSREDAEVWAIGISVRQRIKRPVLHSPESPASNGRSFSN